MEGGDAADFERQEKIAAFMEIVGKPADKARDFLQAANWQLEEAIQLFYAGDENVGPRNDPPSGWEGSGAPLDHEERPSIHSEHEHDEEYVRPPLPVKQEALYEDIFQYQAQHMTQNPSQPSSVDAFRNFQEETNIRAQANGASGAHVNKDSLAALYRPPFALMFQGSFEQAKCEAVKQGKWLLLNLQSTREFSSYMLNRDTWAHETMKDMIQTTFVFWQVYDDTEEGRKVCTYYKLITMPTILILDPLTGQKMRAWEGMVEAERLLEDLVPFMDKGPLDQKHVMLPPSKRPRESSYVPNTHEARINSEEEELRQALAASLQDGHDLVNEKTEQNVSKESSSCLAVPPEETNTQQQHRHYPTLPEEPTMGPGVCRVAVRFPDGTRGQRKFLHSDSIQLLWSFCLAHVKEAADGRSFRLTHTIPGIGGGVLDYDKQVTISEAGLANSMLAMTWN